MKPSPPLVPHWWRRGLDDGTHCESKRRERYFIDYFEAAESDFLSAGLLTVETIGPFTVLYRKAFRLGYDNARLQRERGLRKFKKRAKLGRK